LFCKKFLGEDVMKNKKGYIKASILIVLLLISTISVLGVENTEWEGFLIFEANGLADTVYFGESFNASDGLDTFDVPKPPSSPSPYVYGYFDAGLSVPYNRLLWDIRQYPDGEKIWNLVVKCYPVNEITISWNGIQNTEYNKVYLRNLQNDDEVDLVVTDNYTFMPVSGNNYFEVVCSNIVEITQLLEGWQIFSIPLQYQIQKTDVIVVYDGTEYTWQEAISNNLVVNYLYGWDRENKQYYSASDTLEPGFGYWINSYVNCTLII